jgi:type VI secretion system secreted protein Hcp
MSTPRLVARLLVPALGLALLLPAAAPAASDYYLKLDGVAGESTVQGHEGEIEVSSFAFGVRAGAARPQFADFEFTKAVDQASPALFLRAASGQRPRSALLTVVHAGEARQDFLTYCMTNVRITRVQTTAAARADRPSEEVAMSYATMFQAYRTQKADGTLGTPFTAGWDVIRNMQLFAPGC